MSHPLHYGKRHEEGEFKKGETGVEGFGGRRGLPRKLSGQHGASCYVGPLLP